MEDQSLASPDTTFSSSEQFITQMKLRELRQQRDRLLAAYDDLARDLAALPQGDNSQSGAARLRLLYDRLRSLQFARQPVHPDVANLEVLWYELERDQLSPETLTFWRTRLEDELTQGRLRAEVVYVFSALLEEWTTHGAPTTEQATRQRELTTSLITQWQSGQIAPAPQSAPFFDTLFASLNLNDAKVGQKLRDEADKEVYAPVTSDALKPLLEKISHDTFRTAETRKQAQGFVDNAILLKEFADALTIVIDHLDEWNWSADGVAAQAMWSNTRWRLFLAEDLPNAALLELLGSRWQSVFTEMWEYYANQQLERLKETLPNSRRVSHLKHGIDIWAGITTPDEFTGSDDEDDTWKTKYTSDWGDYWSIISKRVNELDTLHTSGEEEWDHYSGRGGEPNRMERTLALINAELALGRLAFPNRPIYVIKADLQNFYPGLSHDVVLDALTHFGLAERDLAFFRRYLRVPLRQSGNAVTSQTGMPNHRWLSDVLSEALLRLFDLYVESSARAQVDRLVDDICIIAASPDEAVKAWQAAQAFCQACGLTFNAEKSGSVTINGQPLADLPTGLVTWQLLTLGADGEWRVDQSAFEAYMAAARERIANADSIIASAEAYKGEVNYLENALAIHTPLGAVHRQSVMDALSNFHAALFGARRGIATMLLERIGERYLGANATTAPSARLPEAWLYWPVTAGGLGLIQEPLRAATFAEAYAKREVTPPTGKPPRDWQRSDRRWTGYYTWQLALIEPTKPTANAVMEALTNDFISRGASISDGKQTTLSPYWRWILSIYGPQILDAFGTFRFLFTELVPVRLLTQKYLNETDESEEE